MKNLKELNKKLKTFNTIIILLWVVFVGLSFVAADENLQGVLSYVISTVYLTSIIALIFCTIKRFKIKKQIKMIYEQEMPPVDDNIIFARDYYKQILKICFNYLKYWAYSFILASICIATIFYFTKGPIYALIFLILMLISTAITILLVYVIEKASKFPYRELSFNGESFVLFGTPITKGSLGAPIFHVIYKSRVYTSLNIFSFDSSLLTGKLLTPVTCGLIEWFTDSVYRNFLRIDIETEKSGMVQCVYKLGINKFIITTNLDTLKGCIITSRSMLKASKKNKKQNKKT